MSAAATAGSLESGTKIGRYVLGRLIGSGGMGEVYEATHTALNKRVAIKVLRREVASRQEIITRFIREGETAAKIQHPHVIDITDVGVEDGLPYLVMEYLDGESLAQLIHRTGRLSIEQISDLILPVIAAVDVAHGVGIIHRDLKPDNILLTTGPTGDPHPHVLDFGIARVVGDPGAPRLTMTSSLLGTPFYLSPEQATGAKHIDERSDQYALGVILYEAITGTTPCSGQETLLQILNSIAEGRFPSPRSHVPDLLPEFESLILRVMARTPDDRYPTLKGLGHDIIPYASSKVAARWARKFGRPTKPSMSVPMPMPMAPVASQPSAMGSASQPLPGAVPNATSEVTRPDVPHLVDDGRYAESAVSPPPGDSQKRAIPLPAPPPTHTGQTPLPANMAASPPPGNYGQTPPPGNYGQTPPPGDYGQTPPPGDYGQTPPPGNYGQTPPPGGYGAPMTAHGQSMAMAGAPSSSNGKVIAIFAVALVGAGAVIALLATGGGDSDDEAAAPGVEAPVAGNDTAPGPAPETVTEVEVEVDVTVKPSTATIELDGASVGTGSFKRSLLVDGTEHTLRVSNDGYEPWTTTFGDAPPPASIELVAVPQPAAKVTDDKTSRRESRSERRARKAAARARKAEKKAEEAKAKAKAKARRKKKTEVRDPWAK